MENKNLRCTCCGSTSFEFDPLQNGYVCKSCGNLFFDDSDSKCKSVIEEATLKRNNLECKEALKILEAAEEKVNNSSNLYFAKILARYGVIYVKGDNGMLVPTISNPGDDSIFDTQDYRSCIEYAKDQAAKDDFNAKIGVLEDLRKKILAKSNEVLPSDVIICCDETSAECKKQADECYRLLTSGKMLHTYSVFYKPVSLENVDETSAEIRVSKALKTSRFMVVFAGPGAKGLKSSFNKNLLTRYFALVCDDKRKCEKGHGVLTVLCDCLKNDLPTDVASDSHQIISSTQKDFQAFLQEQVSLFVRKVSSSASISSRVIDVVDVKPIVVKEVAIQRKSFAKANVTTIIESSEKSKLDSAYALLSNNARNRHGRALKYAEEILQKNDQSGKGAFVAVLCLNLCDKISDLNNRNFGGLGNNSLLVSYIGKSLEYATPEEYKERMAAYKAMLKNTISLARIDDAIVAYNLLIEYSDSKESIAITRSSLTALRDSILNHAIKSTAAVDAMFKTLYPVFTTVGDPQVLVNAYNKLAAAYFDIRNYAEAIKKFDEALKIYSVDPFALWFKMLAKKKAPNQFVYGTKLTRKPVDGDFDLVNTLITMMKGGYTLSDDEDNYFYKARSVAFEALAEGNKKAGVELYKDLISLIPLDYADLRYNTMSLFPEFLCLKGMFDDANDFYDNIIKDYPTDVDAYVGKLKCLTKSRSVLDLLVVNKAFDDGRFRSVFDTITEIEAQNNYEKSPIRELNNVRDQIIEAIRAARKYKDKDVSMAKFKKSIAIANKICEKGLISPSVELIVNFFKDDKDEILEVARNEEYLAKCFYATYFFDEDISINDSKVVDGVKSITKNVKLTDSDRGMNLKREFLIIGIPAVICWILFLGSLINFDEFSQAIWPKGFLIAFAIVGVIAFIATWITSGTFLGGLFGGALIGGIVAGVILGLATGLCYLLSQAGAFVAGNDNYLGVLAILIGVLPYIIYKIIDIIRKHSYINKRYIVTTVLMFLLLLVSPIIILVIN